MDRPLDTNIVQRNRRQKYLRIGIPLSAAVILFFMISAWMRPSVDRKDILTAVVTKGSIEETISASGTVVPAFEQAISSPTETRVLAVRKLPGEHVLPGDQLLELDRNELTLSLGNTEKEVTVKSSEATQLKLDMARTLSDLRGQLNIKDLRLQYLQSKKSQSEKLLTLGAISKDQMDQAVLDEHIADIERAELEQSVESTRRSLENQLAGKTAEKSALEKEVKEIRRQLDLLSCRADREGIVTWVNTQIGASIHRGDIVARIADLRSYGVEATVSDIHAARLSVGMPARVRINDTEIRARVRTVNPTIENGVARITLALADSSNGLLRPSQRVDVSLVLSRRDNVLKLKKGSFVNGKGEQEVFVVNGGTAERRTVTVGAMSFDEVEIGGGVAEGEEVIISDMNEYKNLAQIKIH